MRKSPQNNKFWVHHIYIEKGTERTSAGTSKSSKTAFIPFGTTNSISENRNNVNTKITKVAMTSNTAWED